MSKRYEPASEFLRAIIAEQVPLSGSITAEANMRLLIAMTHDDDRSNRDWATMLLSHESIDTPEVREALLAAFDDEDDVVRSEALLGIARRDAQLAMPLAKKALPGNHAYMAVFEAAAIIAEPALVDHLRPWTEASDNPWLDQVARDALSACEKGASGP